MSDKTFSFIRALRQTIKRGDLSDPEAAFDAEVRSRIKSSETLRAIRGSALPDSLSFFVPNVSRRDVTAGGAGAGIASKQSIGLYSDLLSWSTAVAQGAQLITDAVGSAHLGMTTSLPGASWMPETGQPADADPVLPVRTLNRNGLVPG